MCGLYFSYFDGINQNSNLSSEALFNKIIFLIKKKNYTRIYELSQAYKDDTYFLKYFKETKERKNIKKIVTILKKQKVSRINNTFLLDAIWNLSIEIDRRYKFVKKYIKNISDEKIIFFKILHNAINSINYQEIRGRDSLGLSVSLVLKKNSLELLNLKKKIKNSDKVFIKAKKELIFITIIYKTYNIIGSLGDNSENILNYISQCKILNFILKNTKILKSYIIAHTRWASVGKINLENTHPVFVKDKINKRVFVAMNGTIQNYKKFIKEKNNLSDTFAIPYLLSKVKSLKNIRNLKKRLEQLQGLFSIIFFFEDDPGKIFIYKTKNQGLYIGKNQNRLVVASDKYGLVEETNQMTDMKEESFIIFDFYENKVNFLKNK